MGFDNLAQAAGHIESSARKGEMNAAKAHWTDIEQAYTELIQELKGFSWESALKTE
jgi:hypothetical protein